MHEYDQTLGADPKSTTERAEEAFDKVPPPKKGAIVLRKVLRAIAAVGAVVAALAVIPLVPQLLLTTSVFLMALQG